MHYAISDLHGCYDVYENALQQLNLQKEDTLYILGDVVDRGEKGIRILQDIMKRDNVVLLKGNHELECFDILEQLVRFGDRFPKVPGLRQQLSHWISQNGGGPTVRDFMDLNSGEQQELLTFVKELPLHEEQEINGQKFFLCHTVGSPEEFAHWEEMTEREFLWARPDWGRQYREDIILVFGHTPTAFFDSAREGQILSSGGLYDIDCGTVFGNPLGCLCLEDLREIYIPHGKFKGK